MTVPTNVRFNLNAPFPSLVTGSGPITVGKQNGIWTIGYSVAGFGQSDPSMAQMTSGAVLVWDSVAQTFSQVPLINLFNFARFMAGSAVVNFATINVDTPITINSPTPNYRIPMIVIANASANITAATWGLFTGPGGGVPAVFAAGQALTITTSAPNAANSLQTPVPGTAATAMWNAKTLYFRNDGTAVAATASVYVWVDPLP